MITIATFGQACHAISALEHAPEHAEIAAGDPRTPFGAAGGPCHDISVTDDALDRAFELLVSFYEHSPAIISRAERALTVAKDRTYCTIRADGGMTIQGSRRYQVTDDGCGVRALTISSDTFTMLCADYVSFLRSFGRESPATQVLIDHTTATVALLADGFTCEAAGSPA